MRAQALSPTKGTSAERDRAEARSGSEQPDLLVHSAKAVPPRASMRAQALSPTKGTSAERDKAEARSGSEQPDLWRTAPRLYLPELPCGRRPYPPPKGTSAERDKAEARSGSEQPDLWRTAPRLYLPELPCGRRPYPAERLLGSRPPTQTQHSLRPVLRHHQIRSPVAIQPTAPGPDRGEPFHHGCFGKRSALGARRKARRSATS